MAFFLQGNKYHICEDVKGLIGFHVRAYPKMVTEGKSAEFIPEHTTTAVLTHNLTAVRLLGKWHKHENSQFHP
jgi:hypothetical protein